LIEVYVRTRSMYVEAVRTVHSLHERLRRVEEENRELRQRQAAFSRRIRELEEELERRAVSAKMEFLGCAARSVMDRLDAGGESYLRVFGDRARRRLLSLAAERIAPRTSLAASVVDFLALATGGEVELTLACAERGDLRLLEAQLAARRVLLDIRGKPEGSPAGEDEPFEIESLSEASDQAEEDGGLLRDLRDV